ncbi:tetratricopeptide repeat protein [Caldimonas brevitalea]|nr:tetratricopeptide repeat protein [Caldimonas brevitalea]
MQTDDDERWEAHLDAYRRADGLYRGGKLKEALLTFRVALSLEPGDSDTLWAIADCYSELGKYWKAKSLYKQAMRDADPGDKGDLTYNIANALLDAGQPRAALKLYRRVPRSSKSFLLAKRNAILAVRRVGSRRA